MSDLFGNHIVGFLTRRLNLYATGYACIDFVHAFLFMFTPKRVKRFNIIIDSVNNILGIQFRMRVYLYKSVIMRKQEFCLGQRAQIGCADQRIYFHYTDILQFLFFLHPNFQASYLLLCLYRPVCVRPGRKPRKPGFWRRGSLMISLLL